MGDERRIIGEYRWTDTLWVCRPFWDEGEDYEPAEGTSVIVSAPTAEAAKRIVAEQDTGVHWWEVWRLTDKYPDGSDQ